MMPCSEIEIEKRYADSDGSKVTIQAGCHGWTVIWADGGSNYNDEDDTAKKNFDKAYLLATDMVGDIKEVTGREICEG